MAREANHKVTGTEGVIESVLSPVKRSLKIPGIGQKTGSKDVNWKRIAESAKDPKDVFGGMLALCAGVKVEVEKDGVKSFVERPQIEVLIERFNEGLWSELRADTANDLGKGASKALRGLKKMLAGFKAMNPDKSDSEIAAMVLEFPGIRQKLEAEGVTLSDELTEVEEVTEVEAA